MLGNGDSTLIVSPKGKTILIDGGEEDQNVLIPYLLARKIKTIDYLIISHFDLDHVGGLYEVIEKLRVKQVIISKQIEEQSNYQKFKNVISNKKTKVKIVDTSSDYTNKMQIEKDLYFEFLWPNIENKFTEDELNNNSIVCKLNYKKFTMLFTGDIEETAEKNIIKKYKNNKQILNATVLKIPHHGSKSSSTEELIKSIKPKIALIGVGENNKFGHPNSEVIKRLEENGTRIYRTDLMGEIEINVNSKGKIKLRTMCN